MLGGVSGGSADADGGRIGDDVGRWPVMRVTGAELEALRVALAPFDTAERRDAYRRGIFPRADRVRDLDKRYRWDLLYHAGGYRILPPSAELDTHIDTALRRVVPPLASDVPAE